MNIINIEVKILATPLNITAFEGMPVKLKCTVKTSAQLRYYKLIWMKEGLFLTSSDYSVESMQFRNGTNIENHYLTIHKATMGAYTCTLVSTSWKVIDAKTQHIITKSEHFIYMSSSSSYKFAIGNSTISTILKDLDGFFKWN